MTWQWTPVMIPLVVGMLLSVALSMYIFGKRHAETSRTGALLLVAGSLWLFGYIMELGSTELASKIFWAKVQYFGIALLPTIWFVYAMLYTGYGRWLKRRVLVVLMLISLIVLLLVFTNDNHHLMWYPEALTTEGSIVLLEQTFGIGFWVFLVYANTMIAVSFALFIRMFLHVRLLYRRQIKALLYAASILAVTAIFDALHLSPFPNFDLIT